MVRASLWALCTVLFVGLLSGEAAASDVDECSSVGKDLKELPPIAELAGNIWESTGIAAFLKRNAPLVAERDVKVREILVEAGQEVKNGEPLLIVEFGKCVKEIKSPADGTLVRVEIAEGQQVVEDQVLAVLEKSWTEGIGRLIMILVGFLLLYLGIEKKFEPLLLVPIGVGAVLCNAPLAGISEPGGLIHFVYEAGIATGFFPVIIFMGVGAMTDFGPLIANPKTVLLGGAAQFGIFFTLIGALFLSEWVTGIDFSMADASAIGIIGGADGPTAIFLAAKLSPRLLGAIAVAAYSYMALVPMIQPPIMKALTTIEERKIRMEQLRYVGKAEKVLFPLVLTMLCILLLPSAAPLMGFFMFGNLMRECGVVERLSNTTQNALINITTIFLGLGVGSKLSAEKFLSLETLGILVLGIIAFSIGTATGIMMAKVMNLCSKTKVNPLIGSAGVSAVPMAARVSQNVGSEADPQNFLLMHAMGPNVAGVIGSALAAGALLAVFG